MQKLTFVCDGCGKEADMETKYQERWFGIHKYIAHDEKQEWEKSEWHFCGQECLLKQVVAAEGALS